MKHITTSEHRQLDLSFVVRNGQTLLDRRLFSYPYVLMRTFREPSGAVHPEGNNRAATLTHLIVQNSSGPVHDRDDLAINLTMNPGTNVRIGWQGATAIHRARSGNLSRERLSISLGEASHLSHLPEARIYFPDAVHQQTTDIELSHRSTLVFTDSFTVHDPDGQSRPLAELDNTLTIRRNGEIVLLDRQRLTSPAFEGGFHAFGTLYLIGLPEPELPEIAGLYAAKSRLPNDLGWSIRLAAADLRPIRELTTALATSPPRPLWGG